MLINCLSCAGKSGGQSERRTDMKPMKEIYLAGGCFWGTEHFLKQIEGVEATQVGYANGNIANPTYKQVCTGTTDFAETVKVQYDPDKVDLPFLIDLYFKTIDPTSQLLPSVGCRDRAFEELLSRRRLSSRLSGQKSGWILPYQSRLVRPGA